LTIQAECRPLQSYNRGIQKEELALSNYGGNGSSEIGIGPGLSSDEKKFDDW